MTALSVALRLMKSFALDYDRLRLDSIVKLVYISSSMNKQLQDKLRLLKIDVLTVLHSLAMTDSIALKLDEISDSTNTAEADLKGIISTLRRMKVGEEPFIQPAGRDSEGRLRWKINEAVISKNELAKFLEEEILGKAGLTIAK